MELFHLGKYSKRRRMLVDVIPVPSSWNVCTQRFNWPTEMKKGLGWYWTVRSGCGLVGIGLDFTPENFWGPWAAHCSRRKPLKGIYLSQFQNMHMPTYQIEMLKMFWNHDATFSMPTSVTALEKEMSRRARWGQESEISLSRESVVTFNWHHSDWVVIVSYKKYSSPSLV